MGMEKSNLSENGAFGREVSHFIYRVPKKNRDKMIQLNKEFTEIIKEYGATHTIFPLNNTKSPMDGVSNIAQTISAKQDEEVLMELIP